MKENSETTDDRRNGYKLKYLYLELIKATNRRGSESDRGKPIPHTDMPVV